MKISYNWLQQHITIVPETSALDSLLTQLGLEVEGITATGITPEQLHGLVVGEVMECEPHPNADKLRITKVNIGSEPLLSIVCGAPNVAKGQKVVVATIGATLYPANGESFKIKKSKIRGEESQGMLCAEDEIGLGTSHAGIIVLPAETAVGTPVSEVIKFEGEALIEIGITPNHADACSHLGIARELKAALTNIGQAAALKYDFKTFPSVEMHDIANPMRVNVEDAERCPRYAGIYIQGVNVMPSPDWLQQKLKSIGLKPINNLVDISNYVLHDIGQPIHIFDADKIKEQIIHVRHGQLNEKFTTLDGVERVLNGTELMICDYEHPMAIAGVFGGIDSGVSATTKNIFIESAYFEPASVRKSARAHGLNTDASFRFERGTDIELVNWAMHFTAKLITENGGGKVSSKIIDLYPKHLGPAEIVLRYSYLRQVTGVDIAPEMVKQILTSIGITIQSESADGLRVQVPFYKNDVTTEVDLCEEVLRIHGLNNVPMPGRINTSLILSGKKHRHAFREELSENLAHKGFNEIMTNSLTKASYPQITEHQRVALLNPLSSDMGVMRDTMLFSGLEVISYNLNRSLNQLNLFETGRTYALPEASPNSNKSGVSRYLETEHCAIFMTGKEEKISAVQPLKSPTFFDMKAIVMQLIQEAGLQNVQSQELENSQYKYGISFTVNGKLLATCGAVASAHLKQADIAQEVFYADILLDVMFKASEKGFRKIKPVSKFPGVRRDLSLLLNEGIQFSQLEACAKTAERKLLKEVGVFDIYKGDKLGEGKKSYALYFVLQDEEKTLEDATIHQSMQRIQVALEKELGAVVR